MSGTAEALAALHAAEAELEAALAAEKVPAAEVSIAADEPVSAPVAVAEAPPAVVLTAEQIAAEQAAIQAYRDAGSPPPAPLETPKWVELPNHLGPIAVNGS